MPYESRGAARASEAWHAMPPAAVLAAFESSRDGLAGQDAAARLSRHGPNTLPSPRQRGPLTRFLLQFHNVLIYVLLASGVITALLGHVVDSSVIFGVTLINAIIGFIQEGKAERSLDAIRKMLSLQSAVMRDGMRRELPAAELVPGDIVFIASGDKVPADLRLIEVRNLKVDESALTGESVPVDKQQGPVAATVPVADRISMAYSGTLVTYGQGVGVVTSTGGSTEVGRISAMLSDVATLTTPLLRQMAVFGRLLTIAILVLAGIAFVFGTLVRDYSVTEMFLAAVGLAVAAIPEGLPAIMTIALAIGVQRMAERQAIIRRLPAVEALGAVTVICTDKTGTLTRNEMTVQQLVMAVGVVDVSGTGYGPHGGFRSSGCEVGAAQSPDLLEVLRAGLLCSDATLRSDNGDWLLSGDPTEGALVALASKAGLDAGFEREAMPRVDVIPFESEHRFMATLHHDHVGRGVVYLKGAPERVLELCARQRANGLDIPLDRPLWASRMQACAERGMRLLAVAARAHPDGMVALQFADVEQGGFTLLAVLGITDPAREEAVRAVRQCRDAGIEVKMITGDHATTARAIGVQLGLAEEVRVVSGPELDAMDAAALQAAAVRCNVFARASPEHKLRLVEALQDSGEVVVMTGDGVNDAPALKRADVGVAMGRKGTEAAKEAAEVVLADDNFASISAAVEQGRAVYDNLRKAILFTLPTNGGEAAMMLIAILLGIALPITPAQILWVNMVTAVTLALAIAFEEPEGDLMQRPPRRPDQPLLSRFLVWRVAFVSALLVAGSLGLFLWEMSRGVPLAEARTAAVNALVVGEIFYLFNCRHINAPILNRQGLFGNPYVLLAIGVLLALQLLFTYLPAMQAMFDTAALGTAAWARILGFGLLLLLTVEAEKLLLRRRTGSAAV